MPPSHTLSLPLIKPPWVRLSQRVARPARVSPALAVAFKRETALQASGVQPASASPRTQTKLPSAPATLPSAPATLPSAPAELLSAQAEYLRDSIGILNVGSTVICLLLAALCWGRGFDVEVLSWTALGMVATAVYLAAQFGLKKSNDSAQSGSLAQQILSGCVAAAVLSGVMFGWGWVTILPHLSVDEHTAFMLANLALLLWCLHVFSPYPPAFLVFASASLLPAVYTMAYAGDVANHRLGTTLGLSLVLLLSTVFALRSARAFKANLALQSRVFGLLEEVTATRDEAVSATQAKSRFLASVSHDLRQPMHSINLYLASMAGHFKRVQANAADRSAQEGVHEGIKRLTDSTRYLNSMFESLLDISRLNSGTVGVDVRHTALHRMMSQLEADFQRQAAVDGLAFEVRLPSQFHLMEVETDPALLERLLRNLLVNAFRYTSNGGVRLSVVAQGRALDFRVVDTGPGIERSLRHRVFDEFFQVPGSQPSAPSGDVDGPVTGGRGIGLGLSISARLAEKLDSRVRLHSRQGRGSVFAVRQPMRIALRPQTDQLPVSPESTPLALPPGLFLAVIDDDADIRRSTRQILELLHAEVYTAESGAQAVEQLGRMGRVPDLVISDFRLGTETGLEVIERLRDEFNHEVPAILITGDTSPERVSEFRRSGLCVLYKPITAEALVGAVTEEWHRSLSCVGP